MLDQLGKERKDRVTTHREVLDVIDAFLADPEVCKDEQRALWDVLTALRSLDTDIGGEGNDVLKGKTTVPVRAAAFPRLTRKALWDYDDSNAYVLDGCAQLGSAFSVEHPGAIDLDPHEQPSRHFLQHTLSAAVWLGLMNLHDEKNL